MKYQAPEGCTGISVGGEQFNVDEKGQIDVPAGDYHALLAPHGFTPVIEPAAAEPVKATTKKAAKVESAPAGAATTE